MSEAKVARTYNQNHVPRKYDRDHRRVSIYVSWSYPAEAGRNPAELDNRFSTMTEVRRVAWPAYEAPQWSDPIQFQQGISGSLELLGCALGSGFAPTFWAKGRIRGPAPKLSELLAARHSLASHPAAKPQRQAP